MLHKIARNPMKNMDFNILDRDLHQQHQNPKVVCKVVLNIEDVENVKFHLGTQKAHWYLLMK